MLHVHLPLGIRHSTLKLPGMYQSQASHSVSRQIVTSGNLQVKYPHIDETSPSGPTAVAVNLPGDRPSKAIEAFLLDQALALPYKPSHQALLV